MERGFVPWVGLVKPVHNLRCSLLLFMQVSISNNRLLLISKTTLYPQPLHQTSRMPLRSHIATQLLVARRSLRALYPKENLICCDQELSEGRRQARIDSLEYPAKGHSAGRTFQWTAHILSVHGSEFPGLPSAFLAASSG